VARSARIRVEFGRETAAERLQSLSLSGGRRRPEGLSSFGSGGGNRRMDVVGPLWSGAGSYMVERTVPAAASPAREGTGPTLPPGPPFPKAVQMLLWFLAIVPFSRWCKRRYGDLFTLNLPFNGLVVQVCNPEGVRQVFSAPPDEARAGEANVVLQPLLGKRSVLLLDGPEHLRQRRLMLPAFHGDRLQTFGPLIEEITLIEMRRWRPGSRVALRGPMQRITLEVILQAVFGVTERAQLPELRDALQALLNVNGQLGLLPGMRHDWGPHSPWGRFLRDRARVDELVYRLIRERRTELDGRSDVERRDVLHTLLLARDEFDRPMNDLELHDELMTLLVAGHETTATALSWFFDLVLRHPSALQRLLAEIDAGTSTEWLDACIRETLRVRPVIPVVARRLHAPLRLMDRVLPAGVVVAPNILVTQRSDDVHHDALTFRPERFLGARPDPGVYFPFGGGIRRCLGASFAHFEMRVVIGTVLRHASLRPVGGNERIRRRAVTLVPQRGARVAVVSVAA
jgi:cytochrome P450